MAYLSNEEIDSIRNKANIVDIISSYLPLTQAGKSYKGVCPFHQDHSPSMHVSPEKGIFKCFACGESGGIFEFVEKYENVSWIEAVEIVANKCGLELSQSIVKGSSNSYFKEEYEIMDLTEKYFVNNLKTSFGEQALAYLKERGIDEDVIKEFGIGLSLDDRDTLLKLLSKKNYEVDKLDELGLINNVNGSVYDFFTRRITFPLWDKDGHIVGFSGRIYRGEKDTSKYMNSKETKIFKKGETLYNYHNAKDVAKREKEIIVVEGFMDAIRVSASGIKNVVALCGTAMTKEQIQLLQKVRGRVILCLDNDNAGEIATLNNGEDLVKNGLDVHVIRLSGEKDPDEYILANGAQAFLENVKKPITFFEFKKNYLKKGKNLNNNQELTQYINSVLQMISSNNDIIFRELTLRELSNEFGLSMDVLNSKLLELQPNQVVQQKSNDQPKVIEKVKKDNFTVCCEKILFFMMNDGLYIDNYKKKIGIFNDALYRQIANEIVYYYESSGTISVADFITYVHDKDEIKGKVMEIVNEAFDDEVTMEAMDEYVTKFFKVSTQNEIERLKQQMKKELDQDKKLKIAMKIAELKKDVF